MSAPEEARHLAEALCAYIERAVARQGGRTEAIKPGHAVAFHWPPHPISRDYHVVGSDWTASAELTVDHERFEVQIAHTAYGVFGRVEGIWNEARGDDVQEVLRRLELGMAPLFERQRTIAETLEREGRFTDTIRHLEPIDLLKLLYCADRGVTREAGTEIEAHASNRLFGPALIAILRDTSHPHRRSAQWVVLDLFEDLPSFCPTAEEQSLAVQAMKNLLWTAEDDFARTAYKAGVVLGGHVCTEEAANAVIECIEAPSKIGRRSAIHATFHLVEWMPELRGRVVDRLERQAETDPEPLLQKYASRMAKDIASEATDHVTEPLFEDEP